MRENDGYEHNKQWRVRKLKIDNAKLERKRNQKSRQKVLVIVIENKQLNRLRIDRLDRANCSNIKYFTVSLISSKLQNATTTDHRGGGQTVLAAPHVALSPAVSVNDRG